MVDTPQIVYEQTTCTFTFSFSGYYTTIAVSNYLLPAIEFMEFLQVHVRFVWRLNVSTTPSRSLASRLAFAQRNTQRQMSLHNSLTSTLHILDFKLPPCSKCCMLSSG